MSADQATQLRRMMAEAKPSAMSGEAPRRRARVIAVASGKGGVGKTCVTVNLAAKLASMSRRVLLLDADLGTANADIIAGVSSRVSLAHAVAGRASMEQVICDTPAGFSLVPGASGLTQMAALSEFERARVLQMLEQISSDYDLILIDTAAGIGPNVAGFAVAADELLVVTTPEPTAITDAYALVKTISRRRDDASVAVLVNGVRDRREGRRVFDRLGTVSRRFLGLSLRYAGHLVLDPRVGEAVRSRRPFVIGDGACPASHCITQLAHKMDRHAKESCEIGFFRRVTNWLVG